MLPLELPPRPLTRYLGSIPGSVGAGSKEDRNEWERRAAKFQTKVAEIERIFLKLCHCDNRELVRPRICLFWLVCSKLKQSLGLL